jgi:hypothetical protein
MDQSVRQTKQKEKRSLVALFCNIYYSDYQANSKKGKLGHYKRRHHQPRRRRLRQLRLKFNRRVLVLETFAVMPVTVAVAAAAMTCAVVSILDTTAVTYIVEHGSANQAATTGTVTVVNAQLQASRYQVQTLASTLAPPAAATATAALANAVMENVGYISGTLTASTIRLVAPTPRNLTLLALALH